MPCRLLELGPSWRPGHSQNPWARMALTPMPTLEVKSISAAVAGDRDALTRLLKKFGPQVRARLSISSSWQSVLDLDDVMQVTYMEAFLRIGQLQMAPTMFKA